MKQGIHPDYRETTVVCTCGNTFTTRSTSQSTRTDVVYTDDHDAGLRLGVMARFGGTTPDPGNAGQEGA